MTFEEMTIKLTKTTKANKWSGKLFRNGLEYKKKHRKKEYLKHIKLRKQQNNGDIRVEEIKKRVKNHSNKLAKKYVKIQ